MPTLLPPPSSWPTSLPVMLASLRPMPPRSAHDPSRIDWAAWALQIHQGQRSAFSTCFHQDPPSWSLDGTWDLPFWVALHAPAQDGSLDEVRPLLDACLDQGVSLYGEPGHVRSLADIQDPAKFAWWLEQGGDPGCGYKNPGSGEQDYSPMWFWLIDHARLDLLDVLKNHRHWPRLARQRGHRMDGAFERWAHLAMTWDTTCGGDNPDERSPDHGMEPYEREDGSVEWIQAAERPGLTTAERVTRALTVWGWLVDHVPHAALDPVWHALWRHNLLNSAVMQAVWRSLRQPSNAGNPAGASHDDRFVVSMDRAWPSFIADLDEPPWVQEMVHRWKADWDRERTRLA